MFAFSFQDDHWLSDVECRFMRNWFFRKLNFYDFNCAGMKRCKSGCYCYGKNSLRDKSTFELTKNHSKCNSETIKGKNCIKVYSYELPFYHRISQKFSHHKFICDFSFQIKLFSSSYWLSTKSSKIKLFAHKLNDPWLILTSFQVSFSKPLELFSITSFVAPFHWTFI